MVWNLLTFVILRPDSRDVVSPYLCQQLKQSEGLLMGLGQQGDGATPVLRAPQQHAPPAQAPNGTAAGVQAARFPTRRASLPIYEGAPPKRDHVAPVHPENPAGHPAEAS